MTAVLFPEPDEAWTPAQLARAMNHPEAPVSEAWVRAHMADGSIPSVKIGRRRFYTHACAVELAGRIDRKAHHASISGFDVRSRLPA